MKLVKPQIAFEATYHDYVKELEDAASRIPFVLTYPTDPFSDLVQNL
jgi:hypothetical protein